MHTEIRIFYECKVNLSVVSASVFTARTVSHLALLREGERPRKEKGRFGPRRRPGRLKRFALGARKEKTVSDLAAAPDGRKRGGWKRAAVSPSRTDQSIGETPPQYNYMLCHCQGRLPCQGVPLQGKGQARRYINSSKGKV